MSKAKDPTAGGSEGGSEGGTDDVLRSYWERDHDLWCEALNDPRLDGLDDEARGHLRSLCRSAARGAGRPPLQLARR